MDFGIVIGMLVSWTLSKLQRASKHLDKEVDYAIDTGAERLHRTVSARLSGDNALETLVAEVEEFGETSDMTKRRLARSLEAAVAQDPDFATQLQELINAQQQQRTVAGGSGVTSGRDIIANTVVGTLQGDMTVTGRPPDPTRLRG